MKKKIFHILVFLLVFLFVYTATAKIFDLRSYQSDLRSQPFPNWLQFVLLPAIPVSELVCALLLSFQKTRRAGLWITLLLLVLFMLYTILVLSHAFNKTPCPCGGIIKYLSWKEHLILNGIFLLITLLSLRLNKQST